MYDNFSADYDRFVDWEGRLGVELPFIVEQLAAAEARRVLDTACGTGMHAIALARRGYRVVGADLSEGMIRRARANGAAAGVDVRFRVAGFGDLYPNVGGGFDGLLCLGNSLPHLLTRSELAAALADFAACLEPGGLLLIQNRNFDRVLARHERWMSPQSHREGERDWLFLRFYDFVPDGTLAFTLVTLQRRGGGEWSQAVTATRLRPWRQEELTAALTQTGFDRLTCWGDMEGRPFDPASSGNLVITARKEKTVGGS